MEKHKRIKRAKNVIVWLTSLLIAFSAIDFSGFTAISAQGRKTK